MVPPLGPTPLLAVDVVALDLETTGLDVRRARIVQIGAVPVSRGALGVGGEFSMLVNPGAPIPASATAIHGLSNADVLGAPGCGEAIAELVHYLDRRPIVGHAISFDLAVLDAEARRVGSEPIVAAVLDTRLLAEIVAPSLPDFTLETLGAWLDVAPDARHTAIGDARTAARIFCALIPHLRERGIRTWAEASSACSALPRNAALARQDAVRSTAGAEQGAGVLARIDAYAYRRRVGEIMTSPARFLQPDGSLRDAAQEMSDRRISSVFLDGGNEVGILTERDFLRAVAAEGAAALDEPAAKFASRPLQCVPADAFVYRALARMNRRKIRHLGVVDGGGALVGALSARDLLRLRASAAIELGDAIDCADDTPALAAAWAPLSSVAAALLSEDLRASQVAAVISSELEAATRRAAQLAETALAAEGEAPPVPYAVLVLGSAGRGESLLALDQDNAIIFQTGAPGGPEDRYFAKLGGRLADTLHAIGVPYCKGGVMAREDAWRGSLETWRGRVAEWVSRSRPEDLLSVDIFFDARAVHGDAAYAEMLVGEARAEAAGAVDFLKLLAAASPTPPGAFNMFGGLRLDEGGRVDLKRAALLPIVSAARVLAIRHGLDERSTQGRLRRLIEMGKGSATDLGAMMVAHQIVLALILRQQVRDIHAGVPPSNRVEAAHLTRREQAELKAALKGVPRLDVLFRDVLF